MDKLPDSVRDYLSLDGRALNCSGYICLDTKKTIIESAGHVSDIDLAKLPDHVTIEQELPVLAGLLPAGHTAACIDNVQLDHTQYFDIHLFADQIGNWIVFVDRTEPAIKLQEEQQQRLDIDFQEEQRKTGN